ncbi:hypothetical protein TcYC6_0062000 [Trypanosoma cruzi]|nr:hypothetical protein TcYC6_0062000 [Trypanosoma cruzi]
MHCMTVRLIRVWLQRMEHVRQYLLGVALMIVEERRHDIVALCVLCGRGMTAIVRDVEDTELFDWKEVADVAAQRERMTDCVCWEGPTIPRPVLEERVLK